MMRKIDIVEEKEEWRDETIVWIGGDITADEMEGLREGGRVGVMGNRGVGDGLGMSGVWLG